MVIGVYDFRASAEWVQASTVKHMGCNAPLCGLRQHLSVIAASVVQAGRGCESSMSSANEGKCRIPR